MLLDQGVMQSVIADIAGNISNQYLNVIIDIVKLQIINDIGIQMPEKNLFEPLKI